MDLKKVGFAFLLGGVIGVLCSLFLMLFTVLGLEGQLKIAATLICISIIGCLLYMAGIYQKFEKAAGAGALLPLSGLAVAVAHVSEHTRAAGASFGKAVWAGFKFIGVDAGVAIIICIVIGVVSTIVSMVA